MLIDTRERTAFMERDLKGSLFSPSNKQFNTVVGSYVADQASIYMVITEDKLEEAVRNLVRIRRDDISG